MPDDEVRKLIAVLTDEEKRTLLTMLRELTLCIQEHHQSLRTSLASE